MDRVFSVESAAAELAQLGEHWVGWAQPKGLQRLLSSSSEAGSNHSRHSSHQRLCQPADQQTLQVTCFAHLLAPNKVHGAGTMLSKPYPAPLTCKVPKSAASVQPTAAPSLPAASSMT